MFGIGGLELLVIAVVALIVLGPKGLPGAARVIGRAMSELRRATSDLRQSIELDPQLKDLPKTLDQLNRPLLTPNPYSRKRAPRDGPPPELDERPRAEETAEPRPEPRVEPHEESDTERTTTKRRPVTPPDVHALPPPHHDEPEGRDR